jgi:hypothetical protein
MPELRFRQPFRLSGTQGVRIGCERGNRARQCFQVAQRTPERAQRTDPLDAVDLQPGVTTRRTLPYRHVADLLEPLPATSRHQEPPSIRLCGNDAGHQGGEVLAQIARQRSFDAAAFRAGRQ